MHFPIRRVDKPWGYELIFAHTDRYVGKILHVDAGHALSLQYHEVKDETLYLSEGEVELVVEENGVLLSRTLRGGRLLPHYPRHSASHGRWGERLRHHRSLHPRARRCRETGGSLWPLVATACFCWPEASC